MKMNEKLSVQKFTTLNIKREHVIEELRNSGCRITKQRMILLDIILRNECVSCKDIHFQALHKDSTIGIVTVYRMINKLEEIGAIDRKAQYRIYDNKFDDTYNERMVLHRGECSVAIKDKQWLE